MFTMYTLYTEYVYVKIKAKWKFKAEYKINGKNKVNKISMAKQSECTVQLAVDL